MQASLVAAFSLIPNPVLINTPLTLTNQMQIAGGTTLNSVNYVINPGACDPSFNAFGAPSLASSFLAPAGTATVPAPGATGGFCFYLKYNFTPSGSPQQSQIVSNPFTSANLAGLVALVILGASMAVFTRVHGHVARTA